MYKIVITSTETGETLVDETPSCVCAGMTNEDGAHGIFYSSCPAIDCAAAILAVNNTVKRYLKADKNIRSAYQYLARKFRPSIFRRKRG